MEEKTIFIRFFGDSPKIKVLDMLLTGRDFEYCISDIAKQANIGRATFYRMLKELTESKVIIPTKKIGRIQLFKLNQKHENVKKLIKLYDHLIDVESEKEIQRQKKPRKLEKVVKY